MKLPAALPSLALLAVAAFLAGCPSTPVRPTPPETTVTGDGSPSSKPDRISPNTLPGADLGPIPVRGDGGNTTGAGLDAGRNILPTVYFDFDKSTVKPAEGEKLKAAVDYLAKNPGAHLVLEGHCDWRGTAEYNLALGDRRAIAVKDFLVRLKVPAEKLETLSKGSLGAMEKGTEEQMGKDRRVELVVVPAVATAPAK